MKTYGSIMGSNHYIGENAMSIREVIEKHSNKLSNVNVLVTLDFHAKHFLLQEKGRDLMMREVL